MNYKNTDLSTKSQSGQIAVVVFLIMAVLLVVGLSLATRTSEEIELAGQQEDTTRVFYAAESGIEEALSNEDNFTGTFSTPKPVTVQSLNETDTKVTVSSVDEYEQTVTAGDTATVFTRDIAGEITITWPQRETACDTAALIVTIYARESGDYVARHFGYRPGDCPGYGDTNFEVVTPSGSTYERDISFQDNTDMIRIKPIFADATLSVSGDIESQYLIRSEASDLDTSGGTAETRAIQVTRTKPAPPSILDYALYSGGTLTK